MFQNKNSYNKKLEAYQSKLNKAIIVTINQLFIIARYFDHIINILE